MGVGGERRVGGGAREEKSDASVWQDGLRYTTITQLLCTMISAMEQATKNTLKRPVGEALGGGNTFQTSNSPGQVSSSWA